ncbi:MAG: ShlB/FhaC/HecB family hemolysin secretion/activation protein [Cyanobacteriota bacterium]|nr:ShlB/FhaC/HecB family hemolysin secretion/activation protein [Cyanobacteriota bacterium]
MHHNFKCVCLILPVTLTLVTYILKANAFEKTHYSPEYNLIQNKLPSNSSVESQFKISSADSSEKEEIKRCKLDDVSSVSKNSPNKSNLAGVKNTAKLTQILKKAEEFPISTPVPKIPVREIKITYSTGKTGDRVLQNEIDKLKKQFERRELTLKEIRELVEKITQLYLNKGYINSIAKPVEGDMKDGVLEIEVTEGRLIEIKVEGLKRLNKSYVCSRIKLGVGIPLNVNKLEDQLKLLRINPIFENVEASLQNTGKVGESVLDIKVKEARPFSSVLTVDNYSPPSIGSERFGVGLGYRNLTGIGDEINGSYFSSNTGGVDVFDITYKVPLNPKNGTLQLRVAPNTNKITQSPFDEFDIRGEKEQYEISYRQPLVRTPREEFALSVGFSYQNGQTFIFNDTPTALLVGPDEDGVSSTSVIQFAQDYINRDPGGSWSFRSLFNFGTGLLDATINDGSIPDGRFFSWLGQAQRVQRLSNNHLLIVQAELQMTTDSLLPAHQFIIGGGQSVRGYRQNARSADNGFRFSIEDRITVKRDESGAPTIQLAPFIDMGAVWNMPDNPNDDILQEQTFLIGGGLGILWNNFIGIDGMKVRLDYGLPFIDLDDRGNNIQDDGLYFSLDYKL